jgi:hypothetical protein
MVALPVRMVSVADGSIVSPKMGAGQPIYGRGSVTDFTETTGSRSWYISPKGCWQSGGKTIVIETLRRQVHDDIYDALRCVETWEDNWTLEELEAVAPVAQGLVRLLVLLLAEGEARARKAHSQEP